MCTNSVDFGLKVLPIEVPWGQSIYYIWVHGPSAYGSKCLADDTGYYNGVTIIGV